MTIKDRFSDYLKILIKKGDYVTSDFLSAKTGYSQRTIKNDIVELNEILIDSTSHIYSKKGKGYYLVVDNQEKFKEFISLLKGYSSPIKKNRILNNSENRIGYLIRKLLVIDYSLTLTEIEEEMYISSATLIRDLKKAKKILSKYDLEIVSFQKKGIAIEGSEINKRLCMADYFFQKYSDDFQVFNNPMLNSKKSQKEIMYIRESLINAANDFEIKLSDLTIQNIVIHCYISLKRYNINKFINDNEFSSSINIDEKSLKAAKKLALLFEKQFKIRIPSSEIKYYALHISSKKINENKKINNKEYKLIINKIIKEIYLKYNIDFSRDDTLKNYLLMHMPAMISRLKNKTIIRNTLTKNFFRSYPLATSITTIACVILEDYFGVKMDDNEIGFLVLYFNVALNAKYSKQKRNIKIISGRGRPESIMMLNELQEHFGNTTNSIEIIDNNCIDSIKHDDIVITTMPIDKTINQNNTLYITGNVNNYYGIIENMLNKQTQEIITISDYLKKDLFFRINANDREDALHKIKEKYNKTNIGKNNINGIFDNAYYMANETGKGIAIVQSTYISDNPFLSIVILEKPIIWEYDSVRILIINQCGKIEYNRYKAICNALSVLMDSIDIKEFSKKTDYKQLLNKFNDICNYRTGAHNE